LAARRKENRMWEFIIDLIDLFWPNKLKKKPKEGEVGGPLSFLLRKRKM
jgi:hypothetical protein